MRLGTWVEVGIGVGVRIMVRDINSNQGIGESGNQRTLKKFGPSTQFQKQVCCLKNYQIIFKKLFLLIFVKILFFVFYLMLIRQ